MSNEIKAQHQYENCVAKLNRASAAYYAGTPIMMDEEFDTCVDLLMDYERENLDGVLSYSPTQRVGHAPMEEGTRHAVPMLSLSKQTELVKARSLSQEIGGELLVQAKIDGLSMSLEYVNGSLVRALTRGDGESGEDVTSTMRLLPSIPTEMAADFTGFVRGEVVIHTDEMSEGMTNARAGAAGSVNHSDPAVAARRKCRFYAFDVLGEGLEDTGEALEAAKEMGFTLAPTTVATHHNVESVINAMIDHRAALPYEADGVVVKTAKYRVRERMGNRTNSPRWAFAFKVPEPTFRTTVRDLIIQVGKSGSIGLRYVVDPVWSGISTVTHATAHNFSEIERLDIRRGDVVDMRLMGGVIPGMVAVDPSLRDGSEKRFEKPTQCPGCASSLETYGTKMQLRCTGSECTPQLIRRLVHWSSRKAANIDGFSTDLIERLVEADRLGNVANIYELTMNDFTRIGRSGDFAKKIVAEIDKSRAVGMRRALIGLSIPQASEGTAKRLAHEYARIEDLMDASVGELASIPDVGLVVASSVHDFFKSPEVQNVVDLLRNFDVQLDRLPEDAPLELSDASGGFSGETVVITGKLTCERDEMKRLVEAAGGRVTGSVSKKSTILLIGENVGAAKTNKARELGTRVITEEVAREMLNE